MDGYHWDMGRVFQFHACLFHGHGCQRFREMWLSNTIPARCECMEQDHLGVGVGASEACRPCHCSHWQAVGHSQLCTVASAWTQLPVPGSDLQVVGGPVACLGQSRVAMAWWPFAVRPTIAGTLMVGTNCQARACRRWPMPTVWPTKPIIMPGSSWTTCRRPTPVWWVTGSHTSSINMTSPSFIWDRTSLTRTPATGPSASMPIMSSCSRTPGTCPRSPTRTSKCTLAAMAPWQLPSRTPQSRVPPATWSWLQPDNALEMSLGLRRWEVSRGEDNKRAPFIHQHALTTATATCAAEGHQHSSCRQQ